MPADRRIWYLAAAAAMLLAVLGLIQAGQVVKPLNLRQPLAKLDLTLGAWRAHSSDQALDTPTLELLKPQDYLLRSYVGANGRQCAVFVAYFGVQLEGAMIHSPRNCLPGGGWQIQSREEVLVPGPGGPYRVNHLTLAQDMDRISVIYWYQGRGRVEPNEYVDRLNLVLDGLWQRRTDGSLVRITSLQPAGDNQVLEGQINLATALIPALDKLLPTNYISSRP
ncbi:MAG: exosortase C-terminal domain/associated protein EpsI [Pseudomonadota bacterium]